MSEIQHITTHADDAVARLIEQYKDKPRMEAWVRAFVAPLQRLEDAAYAVFVQAAIDNAIGAQLDQIGDLVKEKRAGKDDENYRAFLRARIKVNRSNGRVEELITIAVLILGDEFPVIVRELYPSAVEVEVQDVSVDALILWRDFLHKAKGAAKSVQLVYAKEIDDDILLGGSFYSDEIDSFPGSVWTTDIGGKDGAGVFG